MVLGFWGFDMSHPAIEIQNSICVVLGEDNRVWVRHMDTHPKSVKFICRYFWNTCSIRVRCLKERAFSNGPKRVVQIPDSNFLTLTGRYQETPS